MISIIQLLHFQQGTRCELCTKERKSARCGPLSPVWREDREALALEKRFRILVYSHLRRCRKRFGTPKEGHSYEVLGYTSKQLQEHITNHPNWNYVKDFEWHMDHIFPIKAFVDYNIKDLKIINCLDNVQPLTKIDNDRKADKYDPFEFAKWLKNFNIDIIPLK